MNSLNKNGPIIVFTLGIALLLFSMRSFFYPDAGKAPRPGRGEAPVKAVEPEQQPAPEKMKNYSRRKSRGGDTADTGSVQPAAMVATPFQALKLATPPVADTSAAIVELTRKVANTHLQAVGLQMRLPEGMQFGEQTDGEVKILMGSSAPGKIDLYLFSVSGKHPVDKAEQYLKEYFQDQTKLTIKGGNTSYDNRGDFQDGTVIKGANDKGEEFQAFYFRDSKANRTHGLVLIDKQLGKRPAFLRQMFDSIRRH